MNKIAIIFMGLKRFASTTKPNHKKVVDILEQKYNIALYNFYRTDAISECPFAEPGKIQVYEFLTLVDKVQEDIVIKIRSDLYFTDNAIDVLCQEIDNVVSNENDVAYLGIDFLNDYNQTYKRENTKDVSKTTDFVIVARKSSLANTNDVLENMKPVKGKSGNKTFLMILDTNTRAVKVSCQMYLVRKDYKSYDNWQIYYDWCTEYKKSEQAQNWVKNNAAIIRSF
jgi:hypothetical protein|tara:strand:+ start:18976 stop:19653 length:678 start_codon:yes stop_codon:yes gene_type:complete